jgi:hypothetical protein
MIPHLIFDFFDLLKNTHGENKNVESMISGSETKKKEKEKKGKKNSEKKAKNVLFFVGFSF